MTQQASRTRAFVFTTAARPPLPCASLPALAAALRQPAGLKIDPAAIDVLRDPRLAAMYRIHGDSVESEARQASYVLGEVAERLRRLAAAYGEWTEFDACAYFDLRPEQAARLVRVVERVSTVHVTFYADALLPSFQAADAWRREHYAPARRAAYAALAKAGDLEMAVRRLQTVQSKMVACWKRAVAVVDITAAILSAEIGFLATGGGEDEVAAWAWAWERQPGPGAAGALLPEVADVPTLTLSVEFPLPAYRQPGRVRRLRRNRARRQKK